MQQHDSKYFSRRSPTLWMGSKGQNSTFSEHGDVAHQIKGMEHRAPCKHILPPYTTLNLSVGLKGKNNSECGHVAYQFKGKEITTSKHFDLIHTPRLWVSLKSDIEIV